MQKKDVMYRAFVLLSVFFLFLSHKFRDQDDEVIFAVQILSISQDRHLECPGHPVGLHLETNA